MGDSKRITIPRFDRQSLPPSLADTCLFDVSEVSGSLASSPILRLWHIGSCSLTPPGKSICVCTRGISAVLGVDTGVLCFGSSHRDSAVAPAKAKQPFWVPWLVGYWAPYYTTQAGMSICRPRMCDEFPMDDALGQFLGNAPIDQLCSMDGHSLVSSSRVTSG